MQKYIISALVSNKSGVLNRISGLFSRRCYNIESLTVSATEDNAFSRMTIVLIGDEYVKEQVFKQMDKLIDVKKIMIAEEGKSVYRELLLIKVKAEPEVRSEIVQIQEIYRAKVVDCSLHTMILELTGETSKLNGFIAVLEPYGILEMARTGITALTRGEECIKDRKDYNELI